MKLLSAIIALLVIICSVVYITDTTIASTASISYASPSGSGVAKTPPMYQFTTTSGSNFDIELALDASFSSIVETLTNKTDQNSQKPGIQIQSELLNDLQGSTTHYWRARLNGGSFVDGNASFVTVP